MTLEERNRLAAMFDQYSGLLTEKQQNVFDLYYLNDYSLGEIAEEQQISRTAVYDLIKRTDHLLNKYESQLHLAEREMERRAILEELRDLSEGKEEVLKLLYKLGLDE